MSSYDYLRQKTEEFTQSLLNAFQMQPAPPSKPIDTVIFTNQDLTEGVLSDGSKVTVVPAGYPNPNSEICYKIEDGKYLAFREMPKIIYNDAVPANAAYVLVGSRTTANIYIFKLGDSTPYLWLVNPSGNITFTAGARFYTDYTQFDITPDGKHLVYLRITNTALGNLDYEAKVYKDFSLSGGTVTSSSVYTVTGTNGMTCSRTNNFRMLSYIRNGKVYMDFIHFNNPTTGPGTYTTTPTTITFVEGICPEDNNDGTLQTTLDFVSWNNTGFTGLSGVWRLFDDAEFGPNQYFKSSADITACTYWTFRLFGFIPTQFHNYQFQSYPAYASTDGLIGTQYNLINGDTNFNDVYLMTDVLRFGGVHDPLKYSQVHVNAIGTSGNSPSVGVNGVYGTVKAIDSLKFYRQYTTSLNADTSWNVTIDIADYDPSTETLTVTKTKTGAIPQLREKDSSGILNTTSDYIPIAFAIKNGFTS